MMPMIVVFVSTMMMAFLAAGATFLYSSMPQEEREALIALYKSPMATNGRIIPGGKRNRWNLTVSVLSVPKATGKDLRYRGIM